MLGNGDKELNLCCVKEIKCNICNNIFAEKMRKKTVIMWKNSHFLPN